MTRAEGRNTLALLSANLELDYQGHRTLIDLLRVDSKRWSASSST